MRFTFLNIIWVVGSFTVYLGSPVVAVLFAKLYAETAAMTGASSRIGLHCGLYLLGILLGTFIYYICARLISYDRERGPVISHAIYVCFALSIGALIGSFPDIQLLMVAFGFMIPAYTDYMMRSIAKRRVVDHEPHSGLPKRPRSAGDDEVQ